MDTPETIEPTPTEPFLLHQSSQAFLDGDARGIRQRFHFRHDALDYLAMAGVVAGGLLLLVNILQLLRGGRDGEAINATISALGLAAFLIIAGGYYITSRHGAAAARLKLIDQGKVQPGTIVTCSARHETSAEAALGEVTRTYVVTVEYSFTTPAGHELADRDEHDRPELRRAALPPAGAPLRVLYLDDANYALL